LTIDSDDPVEPTVGINLTGASGPPDLAGEWASLEQTCTTSSKGTTCKLAGVLTVANIGYKNVSSATIKFYLSNDDAYDVGDTFLKGMSLGSLKFSFGSNDNGASLSFRFGLVSP
jgi:hypothetical protein